MVNSRSKKPSIRALALSKGWRSGLEEGVAANLKARGVSYTYETLKIKYVKKPATYTPDFILPNGVIIETKGYFTGADRTKHLLVQAQHPDLDIRFLFQRSGTRLSSKSKTTYANWCDKHGFEYADKEVPDGWISGC